MPYDIEKRGGKITVRKKGGQVVGHTTPENYKGYMAALHMHEPKGYADGGIVTPEDPTQQASDIMTQPSSDVQRRNRLYQYLLQKQGGTGNAVANSLASVGDAIARGYGRDSGANALASNIQNQQNTVTKGLENDDTNRQMQLQDYALGRKLIENKREDQAFQLGQDQIKKAQDPTSAVSIGAQRAAELLDPKGAAAGLYKGKSAYDLNPSIGNLAKAGEVESTRNRMNVTLGEKQNQFNQKEFDKIISDNNPTNASARTPLGLIGRANLNADRAMVTLMRPVVTKEEAGTVMADIAGIYQGGSPTELGMKEQEYKTLYGSLQNAKQFLTGNPQDALPDTIKQRLIDTLREMKAVNREVIRNNLNLTEKTKSNIIQNFPEQWKAFRQELEGTMPPQEPSSFAMAGKDLPVVNSDQDFQALPAGSMFIDGNGNTHRKK